jgi:hypothetical protein
MVIRHQHWAALRAAYRKAEPRGFAVSVSSEWFDSNRLTI